MSIRLSQDYLRLTEASCFVNLRFLAFGSSEKDDPCNVSLELFRSCKLCVTSHNIFLTMLRHQFLNRTEQKLSRQLTRLFCMRKIVWARDYNHTMQLSSLTR